MLKKGLTGLKLLVYKALTNKKGGHSSPLNFV